MAMAFAATTEIRISPTSSGISARFPTIETNPFDRWNRTNWLLSALRQRRSRHV